jgi:serine/threonine protein kinase
MYAAPELLKGGDYSTSSDVFAFGSIVWELTRWRKVFDDVCCFPFYFLCLSLFVESIVYVGTGIKLEGGDDQRPYLESRNARNRAVSLSLF